MVAVPSVPSYRVSLQENPGIARLFDLVEEAVTGHGSSGGRKVPSAGALFPYEILIVTSESTATGVPLVLKVDSARGALIRLPFDQAAAAELSRSLDQESGIVHADHVLLMIRPWLSMRKYGSRGYLYSHLDAGHAAVNLLGTALNHGTAVLRLRISRSVVRLLANSDFPYREVHSVISVSFHERYRGTPSFPMLEQDPGAATDATPSTSLQSDLERVCWSQIPSGLLENGEPPSPATLTSLVAADGLSASARIGPREWRRLSQLRRSCARFRGHDLPPDAVAQVISVLTTQLPTDLPKPQEDQSGLRISVLVGPGPVAEACGEALDTDSIRVVASNVIGDEAAVSRLCAGQQHIGGAQALVILHTSRRRLLASARPQVLRDTLFRASAAAHLLYLGATRHQIAVTAVGAYDVDGLRAAAGIDAEDEIVYLIALGIEIEGRGKIDRAAPAHAHGE